MTKMEVGRGTSTVFKTDTEDEKLKNGAPGYAKDGLACRFIFFEIYFQYVFFCYFLFPFFLFFRFFLFFYLFFKILFKDIST